MAFGGGAGVTEVLMKFTGDASGAVNSIKGLGGSFDQTMQTMRRAGTVVFAAVTGSLTAMAVSTARLGDHFAKMSQQTGLSTESLSGLRFAAEQSGSSIEGLEKGILRMTRGMREAAQGVGEYAETYDDLGISVVNTDGTLRSAEEVLMDVADRFAQMEDGTEKAALAQELFGRAGAELIPLLNQGSAGIKELTDEAERLGITFSDEAAKASEDFNDRLNELKLSFTGIKNQIGLVIIEAVTPYIEKVKEVIVQVIAWMKQNKDLVATIVKVVAVIGGVGGLLAIIGMVAPLIAGAISVIFGPVGLIAGLVGIGIAASGLTLKDLPELTDKFKKLFEVVAGGARAIGEFLNILEESTNPIEVNRKAIMQLEYVLGELKRGAFDTSAAYRNLHQSTRENADMSAKLIEVLGNEEAMIEVLEEELDRLKNLKIEEGEETDIAAEAEKRLNEILAKLAGTVYDTGEEVKTLAERLSSIGVISKSEVEEKAVHAFALLTEGVKAGEVTNEAYRQKLIEIIEQLKTVGSEGVEAAKVIMEAWQNLQDVHKQIVDDMVDDTMQANDRIEDDHESTISGLEQDDDDYLRDVGETLDQNVEQHKQAYEEMQRMYEDAINAMMNILGNFFGEWGRRIGQIYSMFRGLLNDISAILRLFTSAGGGWSNFLNAFSGGWGSMLSGMLGSFAAFMAQIMIMLGPLLIILGILASIFDFGGGGGYHGNFPEGYMKAMEDAIMQAKGIRGHPGTWGGGGYGSYQHGGIIPEYVRGIGKSGRMYEFHGPEMVTPMGKGGSPITVNINYPMLLNGAAIKTVTHAVQKELTQKLADLGLVSFAGA